MRSLGYLATGALVFLGLCSYSNASPVERQVSLDGFFDVSRQVNMPDISIQQPEEQTRDDDKTPVQLEMFIMSKCPDAKYCIANLILPVMADLFDEGIVTLKPSYIGKPDNATGGMACLHGSDECVGNIVELCAYERYKSNPRVWLGFINCLSANYTRIADQDFVEGCALEYGVEPKEIDKCASSEDDEAGGKQGGMALLRTSAMRSAQLGFDISCTITINQEKRCVRDDGKWFDCEGGSSVEDLERDIRKAYEKANPKNENGQ